jgi:drug/metabolite transporter (DMT)-like permease
MSQRSRTIAAFIAIYVLWGSTYLGVAIGVASIPPFLLMAARCLAAGVILLAIEGLRAPIRLPTGTWMSAAMGGLLLFAGCHGTLAYAQQYVPTGVAAVVLATIPFWMASLNYLLPSQLRPTAWALVGLIPGLAGVVLITWKTDAQAISIDPAMIILLLGSALSWAAGSLVAQRQGDTVHAIALSGMQLICGGVVLFAISALAGELHLFDPGTVTLQSWAALAYLVVAGSVVGFTAYVWLLEHAPAPMVGTYTFVNPIIAWLLGWGLLGERLSTQMLVGMGLVIASVIVAWRLESGARPGKVCVSRKSTPDNHGRAPAGRAARAAKHDLPIPAGKTLG